MRTIAISIDEESLATLDRMAAGGAGGRGTGNRSALVRAAIEEYIRHRQRNEAEREEDRIIRKNRSRLARECRALLEEQAEP